MSILKVSQSSPPLSSGRYQRWAPSFFHLRMRKSRLWITYQAQSRLLAKMKPGRIVIRRTLVCSLIISDGGRAGKCRMVKWPNHSSGNSGCSSRILSTAFRASLWRCFAQRLVWSSIWYAWPRNTPGQQITPHPPFFRHLISPSGTTASSRGSHFSLQCPAVCQSCSNAQSLISQHVQVILSFVLFVP